MSGSQLNVSTSLHVPTFKFTTTLYKVGLRDIGIIISQSMICIYILYSLQLNTHIVARNQNHILLSLACFYETISLMMPPVRVKAKSTES